MIYYVAALGIYYYNVLFNFKHTEDVYYDDLSYSLKLKLNSDSSKTCNSDNMIDYEIIIATEDELMSNKFE